MPDIFFNTETGCADSVDNVVNALIQASDAYFRIKDHAASMYKECADIDQMCFVRDEHGFSHSFKDCVRSLPKSALNKVMHIVHGLHKGSVIDAADLKNLEGWIVDQIEAHSALMEYAVKNNGILLTVAISAHWKCNLFTFLQHTSSLLPNVWGQEDLSDVEQWIDDWYNSHNSYHDELKRQCADVTLCNRALPEGDFTDNEWRNITDHFKRARDRHYKADDSLIKDLSPNETKYGLLYELRLHSDGIRIFYALQGRNPIVGGYYRYGAGGKKGRDSDTKTAVTRIDAYS